MRIISSFALFYAIGADPSVYSRIFSKCVDNAHSEKILPVASSERSLTRHHLRSDGRANRSSDGHDISKSTGSCAMDRASQRPVPKSAKLEHRENEKKQNDINVHMRFGLVRNASDDTIEDVYRRGTRSSPIT